MVLTLAAAACSSPTSPDHGLSVETRVSATTLRPGEFVTISIVVTNQGKATQRIDVGTCPDPFVVLTTKAAIVGPAEKLCTAISSPMEDLAPGESLTITTAWDGDARAGRAQFPTRLLPAGTYRIQARLATMRGIVVGTPMEIDLAS
jgi:hypothetical protein